MNAHDYSYYPVSPTYFPESEDIEEELLNLVDSDVTSHMSDEGHRLDEVASNNFLICHINSQSLMAHRDDLVNTFSNCLHDLILVSETWLKPSLQSSAVDLRGYRLLRCDRVDRRGGGVAVYVKDNISCRIVKHSSSDKTPSLEYLFIEINLHKKFLVGVLYSPPMCSYFEEFDAVMAELVPIYSEIIMMGDLNTCMIRDSSRSKLLHNIFDSYNLKLINKKPTHHLPNSNTLLDLVVTSMPNKIFTFGQHDAYQFSHHDLIYAALNFKRPKFRRRVIKFRNLNIVDDIHIANRARVVDWKLVYQKPTLDEKVKFLNQRILEIYDDLAPVRTVTVRRPSCAWLNENLKQMMKKRDKLKSLYIKNPTPDNRELYRVMRNTCNHLCRNEKRRFFHENLLNVPPKKVWQTIRSVGIGRKELDSTCNLDADLLAKHFVSPCIPLDRDIKKSTLESLSSSPLPSRPSFEFVAITDNDIRLALNEITSRSVGCDDIGTALLKPIIDEILPVLNHVFNVSLVNGVFPSLWKQAKIIPIPKKQNADDVADFRPISILPTLSKIFEKIIYFQVVSYMDTYSLHNAYQSGFRRGHSTTTALTKVISDIGEAMDKRQLTVLVLLDFSKAFDTIDLDILIARLRILGFSSNTRRFFESYLKGRKIKVDTAQGASAWMDVSTGVPQGSVLGPLLFSIYIQTLLDRTSCRYHLFADDLQIYVHTSPEQFAEDVNKLNFDLALISKKASSMGLVLNTLKTQCIIIGTRRTLSGLDGRCCEIELNGSKIPYSKTVKNLGIIMDETLSWDNQIAAINKRFYYSLHQLRLFKNFLPFQTRKTLFFSLLLPIIDYADVSYIGLTSEQLNKLDRLQNTGIKFIYNLKKYDHVSVFRQNLNLLSIKKRRSWRLLSLGFRVISAQSPAYLYEGLQKLGGEHHHTRAHSNFTLRIPAHTTNFANNSFFLRFSQFWNRLPNSIKGRPSLSSFRVAVRKHLLTAEL